MDAQAFDRLTRTLTVSASRRKGAAGLLAGVLAVLVPDPSLEARDRTRARRRAGHGGEQPAGVRAEARGGKKGKKKKKRGAAPTSPPPDGNVVTPPCVFDGKPGCCGANGQRLPGTTTTACGGSGLPCEDCTTLGEGLICRTDDGEPSCGCDVDLCADMFGCCDGAMRCLRNGTTRVRCGTDGLACQTCTDDEICGQADGSGRLGMECCVDKVGASCGPDVFSRHIYCCKGMGLKCVGGKCERVCGEARDRCGPAFGDAECCEHLECSSGSWCCVPLGYECADTADCCTDACAQDAMTGDKRCLAGFQRACPEGSWCMPGLDCVGTPGRCCEPGQAPCGDRICCRPGGLYRCCPEREMWGTRGVCCHKDDACDDPNARCHDF
jgi:hypothetical protein